MLIVDAQVHIWANHKPTNPNHRQAENYSKDDLLREMDAAGVDAAEVSFPHGIVETRPSRHRR